MCVTQNSRLKYSSNKQEALGNCLSEHVDKMMIFFYESVVKKEEKAPEIYFWYAGQLKYCKLTLKWTIYIGDKRNAYVLEI